MTISDKQQKSLDEFSKLIILGDESRWYDAGAGDSK